MIRDIFLSKMNMRMLVLKISFSSVCHYTRIWVLMTLRLIILLLFTYNTMSARQSKCAAFRKLSRPEKCWVLFHPFSAGWAWTITEHVRNVSEGLVNDSILDGDNNGGQVDAFRHTYWLACLSQSMRWKKALRLSEAHEKGNYLSFKKGRLEDAVLPDSVASAMDRYNNRLGSEIGCRNKEISRDSLKVLVIQMILEGNARIIAKNKQGDFLDAEGNILNMELFKGRWNIPKCLLPSSKRAK